MESRFRQTPLMAIVVLFVAFFAACTRSNQRTEPQREPSPSTGDATAQVEPESTVPVDDVNETPVESCDVSVDCDCPTGTIVAGRRDSESCCDLDCSPGDEIIEVTTGEGRRYRCARCYE